MTEGWHRGPLVDFAELVSTGPFGSMLHKSDYVSHGVPLVNPINITDECIVPDPDKQVGADVLTRLANYVLKPGDVVVGRRGEIGRCAVVEPEQAGWVCGTGCFFIRPRPALNSRFLAQLLRSPRYRERLEKAATGATMQNMSNTTLAQLPLEVPPPGEQQRIVALLDEAFEGIATAKANAEKNLRNARELFESKLQSLFANETLGLKHKTLREVSLDFGRGRSRHRPRNDPKLYGGPYPFIQTGDVRSAEHLITDFTQTYSEVGLAQSKLWPRGTLCITIAANIAETGVLNFDACFPDSVIGVVVDEGQTSSKYLEYMLQTVKADLQAKGKGSAQDNINLATFENERFPFPDRKVQADIVGLLDDLSSEVQRLEGIYETKLAALTELKTSVLHQAFSGALTARSADMQVAEFA